MSAVKHVVATAYKYFSIHLCVYFDRKSTNFVQIYAKKSPFFVFIRFSLLPLPLHFE